MTTTRRDLFNLGAASAAGLIATRLGAVKANQPAALTTLPAAPFNPATAAVMPTRNLGHAGHHVGLFSLGGQAAIEQPNNEKVAIPLIGRALDLGVNYLDTSAWTTSASSKRTPASPGTSCRSMPARSKPLSRR